MILDHTEILKMQERFGRILSNSKLIAQLRKYNFIYSEET